ncbi:ABC transporter ATP-binding protein [Helicobacter marmotae]|uniref:ABC transporter ATP-binding protein n=1 Tax=Helicobacter marmotae TaxID=152490 RepID=A0A3D8I8V7_9HELI|nr:ABC transporter ATP-binding protein [Helicobacter marmotae]RDU60981.1 ABC transporter ATP-binding protein [Helicobacter marmotae]
MAKCVLSCKDITLDFPKPPLKPLLNTISFALEEGEIACVLGPNGSGKSTLLKMILGHFPYKGELCLNGINARELSIRQRAKICGYVAQNYHINFPYSVLEVVLMGRFAHTKLFYSKSDKQKAQEALSLLGIEHLALKPYPLLSGGQKQMCLIARSLAQDSQILLLDEMTSALDISHAFSLLRVIQKLKKSIIFTSHHPEQCFIANKVAMLKDTKLLCYGTPKEILREEYIKALYGIDTQRVELPNGGVYFCPKV